MKLHMALGIGALALFLVALVWWSGFASGAVSGTIIAIGAPAGSGFARGADDFGVLVCLERGAWPPPVSDHDRPVYVHLLAFTRILDGRGRLFTSAAQTDALHAGQRIRVWTTEASMASSPPQIDAVRVQIDANATDGPQPCK